MFEKMKLRQRILLGYLIPLLLLLAVMGLVFINRRHNSTTHWSNYHLLWLQEKVTAERLSFIPSNNVLQPN